MWIMSYATTCKSFEWSTVATLDGHRPFTHRLIEYVLHLSLLMEHNPEVNALDRNPCPCVAQ